jgi:hypothetical protein
VTAANSPLADALRERYLFERVLGHCGRLAIYRKCSCVTEEVDFV